MKTTKEIDFFCKKCNITTNQFFGLITVGGNLYLSSVTSLPDGFNPTVGGSLYLRSVTSLPDGFNPTVGGSLYLSSVTSLPDGFNPTVGGSLYLRSVTSLPDGFNPTVGGDLDLDSVTSLPDGFNPTVGGDLYLDSVTSLPDGFNPTVGGYLYLDSGLKCDFNKLPYNAPLFWKNGKYIKIDGLLQEVIYNRGNVFKVKNIGCVNESYLVTDGYGKYSHGDSIKEAREDLIYKLSNIDKSEFDNLTLDSELSFNKSIECYRIITGACSFGTKDYIRNRLPTKKEKFTIKEIIQLTEKEYGGDVFKHFFNKL